jgi:hypothetical protein
VRIDRRFLNWGVFFILLGAIPLGVQANVLDRDVVARSWQLWPLLIIAAGAGLLLRRTALDFAGGLIAAATVGLIFGGLLAVGGDFGSFGRACGSGGGTAFAGQQGTLGNGSVVVEFNCGDVTVGTAPGSGWTLAGTTNDGQPPRIDASANRLAVRSRDTNVGFLGFGNHQGWTLTLPQDPLLDLNVQVNAGSGRLGYGGAHLDTLEVQGNAGSLVVDLSAVAALQRLDLQMNAGSARIAMPSASLTGNLEVNAGSIAFCVPDGTGLRVTFADSITGSNNFGDQGLTKTGTTWETSNYASATSRISLTTSANAGSITLNPKDGCR